MAGFFYQIVLGEEIIPLRGACAGGEFSTGQQFLLESSSSFVLLFFAYGTALEISKKSQTAKSNGGHYCSHYHWNDSGVSNPWDSGAFCGVDWGRGDPGRCLAGAVAGDFWENHWVYWVPQSCTLPTRQSEGRMDLLNLLNANSLKIKLSS